MRDSAFSCSLSARRALAERACLGESGLSFMADAEEFRPCLRPGFLRTDELYPTVRSADQLQGTYGRRDSSSSLRVARKNPSTSSTLVT